MTDNDDWIVDMSIIIFLYVATTSLAKRTYR